MRNVGLVSFFLFSPLACVEFNPCVENFGPIIGNTAVDFQLSDDCVRKKECPIGNLVTDGILSTLKKRCTGRAAISRCPQIALINAGNLRRETSCGYRDKLSAGIIYESNIDQLLPFENEVVVVKLSGHDIKLALEHSVASIGPPKFRASPHFLHVSGLQFDVDCEGFSQKLAPDGMTIVKEGNRVVNIQLNNDELIIPFDLDATYEVAMPSYLAEGNDGFLGFLLRDKQDRVMEKGDGKFLTKFNGKKDVVFLKQSKPMRERDAVIQYIKDKTTKKQPIREPAGARIRFLPNCDLPSER